MLKAKLLMSTLLVVSKRLKISCCLHVLRILNAKNMCTSSTPNPIDHLSFILLQKRPNNKLPISIAYNFRVILYNCHITWMT